MKRDCWTWIMVMGLMAAPELGGAQDVEALIDIDRTAAGNLAIPVALEGFQGEVLQALRFDLAIQGFEVVDSSKAQYVLSGSQGNSLVGRVKDRISGQTLLSREYRGGTARAQAHTFADAFVETFPGRIGIARSRIVFRVETSAGSELFLTDYDGYNHTQLTVDGTITRDPAWVPGQNRLFYTSYLSGLPRIYSHDLQTGQRKLLAGFGGLNGSAAVSPDGQRVAMILSKSGSPDLYVANLDGTNLKRLTQTKEDESSPCWSPDGRTLCVASRQGGKPALYKVPVQGGPMQRISIPGSGSVTEPSWSPDGKWIAYTASFGGFQICVVPAQGGRYQVLDQGEDPVWAANSRTLLYTKRSGGRKVLSLLDVPTKEIKDVRRFSGNCSQPEWVR